jgi:hypothetical protein
VIPGVEKGEKSYPSVCKLFYICVGVHEELHNLYSSPSIIRQMKSRRMRWSGHVACIGQERKVYKVLVGKPKGNILLSVPRHRWEDRIRR